MASANDILSNGHTHQLVISAYELVANFQKKIRGQAGFFGLNHNLVQFDGLSGQHGIFELSGLSLNIVYRVEHIAKQLRELAFVCLLRLNLDRLGAVYALKKTRYEPFYIAYVRRHV